MGESWHQLQALERVDSLGIYSSQWGSFRMLTAMVAARAGMRDSANAIMRAIHADAAAHPGSSFRTVEAGVRMLLGERAAALGLLAEELREDPLVRGQVVRSPWFRAIATDSTLR